MKFIHAIRHKKTGRFIRSYQDYNQLSKWKEGRVFGGTSSLHFALLSPNSVGGIMSYLKDKENIDEQIEILTFAVTDALSYSMSAKDFQDANKRRQIHTIQQEKISNYLDSALKSQISI